MCHCEAVRNTLTDIQVSQTSKTCSHARNNWGTWRGHNFHFEASEAIRGSVMHLIRLVFSHLAGSYLLYWHNCGVVTNSRQPTPTWPGFPAILQRRSGRNQLPGSYRTTQSGLTHSVHSRQIHQEWMDQLLEHCKGLDQQQGFAVLLTLLKALNSIPGRSSSMQV